MKALLVLEDGFCLQGKSFTGDFETGGEVIFNTGMTGYQEVLTDPSYYGQMVCMTYPLIGNYGITAEDMESGRVHMRALLVKECCKEPSNWRSKESLPDFLKRWNVPGMEGLDTRALTRHLRINGAMRGIISTRDLDVESLRAKACALPSMEGQNLVPFVAAQKPYILTADGPKDAQFDANGAYAWQGTGIPLLVYDFGVKWNILRLLAEVGFEPLAVPPSFTPDQARASGAKGVFLSNGPGDPATLTDEIVTIKKLVESYPVAGICLGHQCIGEAFGGTVSYAKTLFHGKQSEVTHCLDGVFTGIDTPVKVARYHSLAVLRDDLPECLKVTAQTADGEIMAMRHKEYPVVGLQFHPESIYTEHGKRMIENFLSGVI